jgi:hypothetical protein
MQRDGVNELVKGQDIRANMMLVINGKVEFVHYAAKTPEGDTVELLLSGNRTYYVQLEDDVAMPPPAAKAEAITAELAGQSLDQLNYTYETCSPAIWTQVEAAIQVALIKEIRTYCLRHYEDKTQPGLDFLVECWSDADIVEIIGTKCRTLRGAMIKVRKVCSALHSRRLDQEGNF